jgi:serine/threonine-protein kinase
VTSTIGFGTAGELPVSFTIPGYRLRRVVGSDAIGLWMDCEQTSLGRKLTLKVLKPEFETNEAAHRDFLAEMDRLAALNHPNLLQVLDSRREPPLALVTERIGAQTLDTLLESGKPVRSEEALPHLLSVSHALDYIHGEGFTHKNLSPRLVALNASNVARLVTYRNIVTFDQLAALRGKIIQDPNYVAPEQLGGDRPIGAKASSYQLAAIMFHLLAGQPPHTDSDKKKVALAHFREPFPSLKSRQPFLRPGIFSLIADCTQRDPDARPDMSEFADRIEAVIEKRDEPEKKPGGAPRSRRRRRRRR